MFVELKSAGIPFLGTIAVHYWFVIDRRERWEVWQRANAGGRSVGHVYRDLLPPDSPVGGGPAVLERSWDGAEAARLAAVLRQSWALYPHRHLYRIVPGPNSNTYAAWVLRRAKIDHQLSWKGIGRNYAC